MSMNIGIIGGGASGVLCAIKLKENKDFNVTIIEQNDRLLKKGLKTGNGKCNIMNNNISSIYYNDYSLIENQNINVYQELSNLGIVLKELSLGRVYPYSEQSKTVVNILLKHISKLGINVKVNERVLHIKKDNDKYIVYTNDNVYKFDKLIIATGSNSQEKTNGYELVKELGLTVTKLTPGLVPLEVLEDTKSCSGLRIKCSTVINGYSLDGELLFKDDGISGIIVLDVSRFCDKGDTISFDLMKEYQEEDLFKLIDYDNPLDSLEGIFPKMIALDIIKRSKKLNESIPHVIKNYTFTIKNKKGFNDSQITLGGVETNLVNHNFEVINHKNLFILGELLNVDGASGGYNLYFAWLSAITCSNYIKNLYKNLNGSES